MPLDHYVPQVHLKNFYSPSLKEAMYAIRKEDLKIFPQNAKSLCRIENNSTNSYLREDRCVEEFLKTVEPRYNMAVEKMKSGNIDEQCIYVISGFVAYVMACSPAGMRIQSQPLKSMVEETVMLLDSQGELPDIPPILGAKNLTELLNSGKMDIVVDKKFPQAIGINSILSIIRSFGNFRWDILMNPFNENPFFTSDFPVAIENSNDIRILNRIIPLAPDLAIRIRPDLAIKSDHTDFSFSRFSHSSHNLGRKAVVDINRLIVRCAETTVFFRDNLKWVLAFVERNSRFRIEPQTIKIPHGKGNLSFFKPEVMEIDKS